MTSTRAIAPHIVLRRSGAMRRTSKNTRGRPQLERDQKRASFSKGEPFRLGPKLVDVSKRDRY